MPAWSLVSDLTVAWRECYHIIGMCQDGGMRVQSGCFVESCARRHIARLQYWHWLIVTLTAVSLHQPHPPLPPRRATLVPAPRRRQAQLKSCVHGEARGMLPLARRMKRHPAPVVKPTVQAERRPRRREGTSCSLCQFPVPLRVARAEPTPTYPLSARARVVCGRPRAAKLAASIDN